MDRDIMEKAGLYYAGKDEEGEDQFIGTRREWNLAEQMQNARDNEVDLEKESSLNY